MDEVLAAFRPTQPVAAHDQIAAHLRQQILAGTLPPRARLPTTQQLASTWGVTVTTIQTALAPLVKEGLLLRRPRVGTIVRERPSVLGRVGLYRPSDPGREGRDHYARRLAAVISARLEAAGATTTYFTDLRPEAEQVTPPADLLNAVRTRQLDAVIATESNRRISPWLAQLPVPTACTGSDRGATEVTEDFSQFARDGVARLAEHGCRSVGLLSVLSAEDTYPDGTPHLHRALHDTFIAQAAALGLATRPAWIRVPPRDGHIHENVAESYGYEGVRAICGGRERPDGLLVFTDLVARGAIMGLLALKSEGVPTPRLVLHRNAEIGLFCPLPADFLENCIDAVADALLGLIEAQRTGAPTACVQLPFRLVCGG